jgi:hypothetical protein
MKIPGSINFQFCLCTFSPFRHCAIIYPPPPLLRFRVDSAKQRLCHYLPTPTPPSLSRSFSEAKPGGDLFADYYTVAPSGTFNLLQLSSSEALAKEDLFNF